MKPVVVVPYDPAWPEWFLELRQAIWPAVKDTAVAIEHVGSTSVPGLAAKAAIDIDLVIRTPNGLNAIIVRLAALGYRHRGDLGIAGREVFRPPSGASIPHHLYVCAEGSLPLSNHLLLRDHLRHHPEDAAAYAALKLDLARRYPQDMDSYIAGKSDFILGILRRSGLDPDSVSAIAAMNQQ